MIKRNWFISVEFYVGVRKTVCWRQFHSTSFFPNPAKEISFIVDEIAKEMQVDISEIAVITFNRV